MSFEFTIPVARDDLLNRTGVDQYVVDEVLTLREIAGTLQGNYCIIGLDKQNISGSAVAQW